MDIRPKLPLDNLLAKLHHILTEIWTEIGLHKFSRTTHFKIDSLKQEQQLQGKLKFVLNYTFYLKCVEIQIMLIVVQKIANILIFGLSQ